MSCFFLNKPNKASLLSNLPLNVDKMEISLDFDCTANTNTIGNHPIVVLAIFYV